MKGFIGIIVVAVLCFATASFAQMGAPGVPGMPSITTTIGVGGGLSMPSGDLSNSVNSGYHGVAKLTLGAILPFDLAGEVSYHHLPFTQGSDALNDLQIGVGIQYPLGLPIVNPYISVLAAYNSLSSSAPNFASESREGVNLGVGAKFLMFDATVQYDLLNLAGKNSGENTNDMITLSVMYSFGL
jgi:hypothetical protein